MLFFNLGIAAGISKVTDDGLQLLLEVLISTATDPSTAGVARHAAAASSLTVLQRAADFMTYFCRCEGIPPVGEGRYAIDRRIRY